MFFRLSFLLHISKITSNSQVKLSLTNLNIRLCIHLCSRLSMLLRWLNWVFFGQNECYVSYTAQQSVCSLECIVNTHIIKTIGTINTERLLQIRSRVHTQPTKEGNKDI